MAMRAFGTGDKMLKMSKASVSSVDCRSIGENAQAILTRHDPRSHSESMLAASASVISHFAC